MAYEEKIDLLDLVITALKDHEKRLDRIVSKLEKFANELEEEKRGVIQKLLSREKGRR